MFLLDTNVVSELRKTGDGRADVNVTAWLAEQDAALLNISVVTLMELEYGICKLERRDAEQGARLRTWMNERVQPEFKARTLPIDADVASRCARLHVPDPQPERDAYIAATALVHGLTVVTRNSADFKASEVALLNPWLPEQ